MVLNGGRASEVVLFQTPSASLNGLWTTGLYASDVWRIGSRLTLTAGVVFDRYRSYLPEQIGPPVGPFNTTQTSFAAVNNLITWNLTAPRIGFTYDLTGNGKTVLKANYASYWWNPGTTSIDSLVNPNSPDWYRRYAWNDANGDKVWQPGEQTTLNSSSGGVGSTQLDPNLQDQRTREVATFLERELFPNFGVHAGFVWRRIDQLYQSDNLNRPISAFDVPVTVHDPGADGKLGAAGPSIQAFNLNPANLALPVVNFLHNTPGKDDFYNLELSANKRMSNRWALNASYAYRWNKDLATGYFGQRTKGALASDQDVANPNDLINTDNGRYNFGLWTAKVNGTYDAPLGLRLTPAIRMQSGQPYARTFLVTMNYGSQRFLAEPFGTRRQDNIILVDTRVEKLIRLAKSKTVSVFVDGYNLTNSNAAVNINWASGTTFTTPTTIVPPRLFRFGAKFDW